MATLREVVEFTGHPMLKATHPTTIEVTRDSHLTPNGDCIVGVSADRSLADFSGEIRRAIQSNGLLVSITIATDNGSFRFAARGDPRLTLSSVKDIVIRKSTYVCGRTLAVSAEVAARDVPRRLVRDLRNPDCRGRLAVEVSLP